MTDKNPEGNIIQKILEKSGHPSLLSDLVSDFSMSEINTLLLELFRAKVREMSPAELLRHYAQNRFASPSDIDPVRLYRFSADLLEAAARAGYNALELSPVTILGSCSVMAKVDQNNVLSAFRGTEVLSDATNALALHIAFLKSQNSKSHGIKVRGSKGQVSISQDSIKKPEQQKLDGPVARSRFCAVHRHVRAQKFGGKNQLPHFFLYGMVISGIDEGNYKFEKEALRETLSFYHEYLLGQSYLKNLRIIIWPRACVWPRTGNFAEGMYAFLRENNFRNIGVEEAPSESDYYRGLQFKIKADCEDKEYEICDGGFVDWPEKLLQNKKERMLISGMGLERLMRLKL